MPTSPIPNWDEALLVEPLPDAAFVPVFELVWLSSPHAARSSANAPAPPAPTIFRNFLRDAGSASIRRTAPSCGFGSSIGGTSIGGLPAARCLRRPGRSGSGARRVGAGPLACWLPSQGDRPYAWAAVRPGEGDGGARRPAAARLRGV